MEKETILSNSSFLKLAKLWYPNFYIQKRKECS